MDCETHVEYVHHCSSTFRQDFDEKSEGCSSNCADLSAFSDSDFASCLDTARSTSRNVILKNTGVIALYSDSQTTAEFYTDMAEIIVLAKVVVKVKDVRAILFDLQCRQVEPTYAQTVQLYGPVCGYYCTVSCVGCCKMVMISIMKQLGMLLSDSCKNVYTVQSKLILLY